MSLNNKNQFSPFPISQSGENIFSPTYFSPLNVISTPSPLFGKGNQNQNQDYDTLFDKVCNDNFDYVQKRQTPVMFQQKPLTPNLGRIFPFSPSDILNLEDNKTNKHINFKPANVPVVIKPLPFLKVDSVPRFQHYPVQNQNIRLHQQQKVKVISTRKRKRDENNTEDTVIIKKKMKLTKLKIPTRRHNLQKPIINEDEDENIKNNNSVWNESFANDNFIGILNCSIKTKTRCNNFEESLPNTLYSSLKYVLSQKIFGVSSKCDNIPFVLSKITVIDEVESKEILKNKKIILKGTTQAALNKNSGLSKKNSTEFDGSLKVQFTDVSYHHKKHNFCFRISYYLPNDLENPILIMTSKGFKVLARKPNQGKKKKKRVKKKKKTVRKRRNASSIDNFNDRLDQLIDSSRTLKGEERSNAFKLISERLFKLDPEFFRNFENLSRK